MKHMILLVVAAGMVAAAFAENMARLGLKRLVGHGRGGKEAFERSSCHWRGRVMVCPELRQ